MIKELIKLATHLDEKGLAKEANYLDMIIKRAAPIANGKAYNTFLLQVKSFIEYFARRTIGPVVGHGPNQAIPR